MMLERLVAAIMLVALTFGAGLEVDREHLIATLKNAPLLVKALLANFVIVPISGILIAKLLRLPPAVATGYLLMAIAPGVPFVLAGVRKKGGRLGLAVALVLFLPLLSIVTVPITAAIVLPPGAAAQIPLGRFVVTLLLFQLVPLVVGIVVGRSFPDLRAKLARPVQLVFAVAVLALLILLAPTLARDVALVFGSNGMWAMLILVLFSMGIGWWLGGPEREDRRVLGLGTALRNIGLCALIASTSFHEPLVTATVLTYFLIQFVVTTVFGIYFKRTAGVSTA